jgi:endonuclease/exonuclease/phosphatase family metal-dependent hydrolase
MQWAREIAAAKPDLVRLQEAAEWRTQFPSDFSPTPDATTVAADFVNLLVGDLAALGVHYTVAAADTGYDVEAPGLCPFGFMDVRVTQHDAANLDNPQPTLDERIDHVFTRGPWQAVNATIVGASPADKTASNRWPSDHAGVLAKLNLQGQS